VIRYVPSGNVPESAVTISEELDESTVRGSRSNVTSGGVACPEAGLAGHEKFCPSMTSRLLSASNVALVTTSCGADDDAAVTTCAHRISAPNPRTVVNDRFRSVICNPPVTAVRVAK
jgi:hypothetical protein